VKVPEEIRHVGALWAIASKGRLEGMGCILSNRVDLANEDYLKKLQLLNTISNYQLPLSGGFHVLN
jgi:hypothetical protein